MLCWTRYDGKTWGGFHDDLPSAQKTLRQAMGVGPAAKLPMRTKAQPYQRKMVTGYLEKGRKPIDLLPKTLMFRLKCVWEYAKRRQKQQKDPLAGPGDLLASIKHCKKSAKMYVKDCLQCWLMMNACWLVQPKCPACWLLFDLFCQIQLFLFMIDSKWPAC